MNDDMYKSSGKGNSILIVIVILILIAGGYVLFFKDNNEEPPLNNNDNINNNDQVNNNANKITFVKKTSGKTGDIYLSSDNKAYFVLASTTTGENLIALSQEYDVEKNDVYMTDKMMAILIVLPNVINVDYSSEEGTFILITGGETAYTISDADILANDRIYPVEVVTNTDTPSDGGDDPSGGNNTGQDTGDNTGTGTTPGTGSSNPELMKRIEELLKKNGVNTGHTGNNTGTTNSGKETQCKCRNGKWGTLINDRCYVLPKCDLKTGLNCSYTLSDSMLCE